MSSKQTSKPERRERQVLIRFATPADVVAINKVYQETWLDTYPNEAIGISTEDILTMDFDSPERVQKMREALTAESDTIKRLVAEVDNQIVGVSVVLLGDSPEIKTLYVLPSEQGTGLGKRLTEEALAIIGSDKPVRLEVASYNQKAIDFYKRMGFEVAPQELVRQTHYVNGKLMPTMVMVRKVSSK